ncbi:hypothetical protein RI578_12215 [Streptomyces sp. BB1-1-1]|uniref:hypothetical protein n=1 Tax=Streptomyces sp. BB1-1-1 TaxID=3074430 RepID=UPI002877C3E0|nr:hypothetical protein [Streptomyces sp. BB1-1-1]WND34999.1 hypothetical protein RI578_12215 [Streptomyces sp. BB1-1-1]
MTSYGTHDCGGVVNLGENPLSSGQGRFEPDLLGLLTRAQAIAAGLPDTEHDLASHLLTFATL